VDRDLRITGANRQWDSFAQAHGKAYLPSSEILGTPVLSLMKGVQLERWRGVCQQILRGEIPRYLDEVARQGRVAWRNYSLSASPLQDGQGEIVGITFVATNITQLKKAEAEMLTRMVHVRGLRQLSHVAGSMFDWRTFHKQVTADLAHLFDAQKCIIFRWDEGTGHLQAQVPAYGLDSLEKFELPLELGDPDDPSSLWQELEEKDYILLNDEPHSLDTGRGSSGRAGRLAAMMAVLRVSGRVHGAILVTGRDRPFSDQDGQLLATFAVPIVLSIEDAELNQRLRDRARKLAAAREELSRVFRAVESVRMPITVIRGYLELLLDGALGPVSEGQVTTMNMLLDKTREIADHIGNLLPSQFMPDANRYESIQLAGLIRKVLYRRNASIKLAGLNLVTRLPSADDQEYMTAGDPDMLFSVFDALLDNAIKYSPNGGTIRVSLHESSQIIYVRVNDPGIGIAPRDLEHIWQPKENKEPSDSISLAEVKRIVETHGGHVWVESQLGQGSIFYVVLPKITTHLMPQQQAPLVEMA
jgi:PAS domain S-box-containing protein